jgi:hypothetical protein
MSANSSTSSSEGAIIARHPAGYWRDCTRPQRAARSYLRTFLALVLPALALLMASSIYYEPIQGDLTRVGGFTENAYGWNATHKRFVPPLVATRYDQPFDIVVLGDSYSVNPGGQTDHGAYWTNYLAQQTGLSVVALSLHRMSVRDLVDHPVFRRSPPRLVVLEMVERYLVRNLVIEQRWVGPGFDGCPAPGPAPPVRLSQPLKATPVAWQRADAFGFHFDQAVDLLWKSAGRAVDIDRTRARSLELTGPGPFSSAANDRLLVYDDELRPLPWSRAEIDQALCRLRAIQDRVQANGQTAFMFMAAPDKLSVYSDHVADAGLRGRSRLGPFHAEPRLNHANLLGPLRDGVRCGLVDVYLPNDTHWGTPGHEIVAGALTAALADRPADIPGCRSLPRRE